MASFYRQQIDLELASLIQKLAFLRGGGMTPSTFPPAEHAAIEAFGITCCRLSASHARTLDAGAGVYGFNADGDYNRGPSDDADEDTLPSYRLKKE